MIRVISQRAPAAGQPDFIRFDRMQQIISHLVQKLLGTSIDDDFLVRIEKFGQFVQMPRDVKRPAHWRLELSQVDLLCHQRVGIVILEDLEKSEADAALAV